MLSRLFAFSLNTGFGLSLLQSYVSSTCFLDSLSTALMHHRLAYASSYEGPEVVACLMPTDCELESCVWPLLDCADPVNYGEYLRRVQFIESSYSWLLHWHRGFLQAVQCFRPSIDCKSLYAASFYAVFLI